MTALFTGYVGALLDEAAANPAGAWQAKDCAVYLVTALVRRAWRLPEVFNTLYKGEEGLQCTEHEQYGFAE